MVNGNAPLDCLSKILDNEFWDVVATKMSSGALTWMNTKLNAAEQWGGEPWPEWQAFVTALKAQFEPLSREEHAHEQIRKLSQTGNVSNYIYHFHELMNEIPSMNSAEAYSLFMHSLDPQLRQLAGTLVTSGDLDEIIEIVKKAAVYREDQKTNSQSKGENKRKG